ncbi:MAG: GlsB/YeaQ/YmgE family stress response membrane protein [Melioribacteraceae bacterium]|nr:GlsB/YeaQ/YmgE family stress response membrane protein [Melioribacteraceae bacterium]MCF8414023.1 GlsB/YeaQ/YmgE family stress response membrane protein [Melioribacteraceae bacterium]MCF8432525.1 GlsB/YeaQ/YmgE family stress response membrane protein [Melioribacteraceae bacterium]
MDFLYFLVIGLIAGFLAGKIMKGKGFGLLGNLALGIAGAFIGGFLFGLIGLASYGFIGSIVTATVGAIFLIWLVGKLK